MYKEMRKYSRRKNLISVKWVCIVAAAAAVLETVFYFVDLLYLSVVCFGLFAVLAVFLLSMFFVAEEKYACLSSAIGIYFLGIRIKKIKFSDIKSITISNASFNTGTGYLGAPILSCRKNTETGEKSPYPHILIYPADAPFRKYRAGMNSYQIYELSASEPWENEPYSLGICWFEPFAEIVQKTSCPVYVLQDVYAREKKSFDKVFSEKSGLSERLVVVA